MRTAAALLLPALLLAAAPRLPAQQPQAPAPAAAGAGADGSGDFLAFNFDNVDVRVFAQVVGAFTGRRIVVADDAAGKVTVFSHPASRDEAFAIFSAALEASGFTIVPDKDGLQRVVRLPEREGTGMGPVVTDPDLLPEHGLVTFVLRLEHVPASEMRDLLEAQLRRKGFITAMQETNHLVFTDTAENVRRILELAGRLDRPGMARVTEVFAVEHAEAAQLARELSASFAADQTRAQQLLARLPATSPAGSAPPALTPPTIIPVEHSNRLLVTGTPRQLDMVRELLVKMDVEAPSGHSAFNFVPLSYLRAADIAKNLTTLLEKFAAGTVDPALSRRIAVEAVVSRNALLVNASPADFREVKALLEQLDVPPEQVHVEVLIAEVSEGDTDTLGVQITGLRTPDRVGGVGVGAASRFNDETATGSGTLGAVASGLFGEGITFGIAHGSHLDANGNVVSDYPALFTIDAVRQNSRVRILANPSLAAANNVEAEVAIVDNIPLTESNITGTGDSREVIQTITRQDVGVKLSFTPHVVPGGLVQMELNPSIEAVTDTGRSGAADYAPTISKRSVKTTMTVPDGETIVIAGLSRTDTTMIERKVPLLGDIPLLGWLFRWDSEVEQRTNILIFVTPHVMGDADAARAVRESLEAATGLSASEAAAELAAPPPPAEDGAETEPVP